MLHTLALVTLLTLQPAPPAPTLAQVASQHFSTWDADHDGTLTPSEIDAMCVDPAIRGPEAAAAAALKRILRSGKYEVPPLTLEALTAPAPKAAKAPADRADSPEGAGLAALKPANFQASYTASLRRISGAKRALFLDETPDLDKCHQGPLGDCYFVAAVGAMVHRDPASVRAMVSQREDGGYDAKFGDGRSIQLAPLTDSELALSGTTGDEGLWLPVLEKALGSLRREADPKKYASETATDAIANGGSSASIIKMLTGHQTARVQLKKRVKSTEKGADGKPVELPPAAAGEPAELAAKVRTALTDAFTNNLLVTCGTGTEKQPPGVSPKHAYAILSFDAKADTATLWNPHGNTFRPKGEPGLSTGYPTKAGMFTLPVTDLVQIFSGVVMETQTPLQPNPPAPAAATAPSSATP